MARINKEPRIFIIIAAALLAGFAVTSCSIKQVSPPAPENEAVNVEESQPPSPSRVQTDDISDIGDEGAFIAAMRDRKAGRISAAIPVFKEIRSRHPTTEWGARASLLLALTSEDEPSATVHDYFADAYRLTEIQDYVLFYQAGRYASDKNYRDAAVLYAILIDQHPSSSLRSLALYKMAGAYADGQRYDDARDAFADFLKIYPGDALADDALLSLANACLALNGVGEAIEAARRILMLHPASKAAKQASMLLSKLRASGVEVPPFTNEERYIRGEAFFNYARYNDAIDEFAPSLKDKKYYYHDDAAIKTIEAWIRLKRYDTAEKAAKDYIAEPKGTKDAEALEKLSLIALRQDNETLLNDTAKAIARRHPDSLSEARALIYLAGLYDGKGNKAKAADIYRSVIDRFAGTNAQYDAIWGIAWDAYRNGDYNGAHNILTCCGTPPQRGRFYPQFLYWRARSAEKAGDAQAADDAYQRLCEDAVESYYCKVAILRRGESIRPAKTKPVETERNTQTTDGGDLYSDARYGAMNELILVGLEKEAAKELILLTKRHEDDREALMHSAALFYQLGDYYHALQIPGKLLYANGNGADENETLLKLPINLIDAMNADIDLSGADPYLIAAIIKEESAFNPSALSGAGAMGLMQLMPSTAKALAKEIGDDNFSVNSLYEPSSNIRLGSFYISRLIKRFGNDTILAVAGYNAGEDKVENWTLPPALDEMIESIPYTETRNYAKRVLRNYISYMALGGIDPKARIGRAVDGAGR